MKVLKITMRQGDQINKVILGPQIGQGAFGSIFAARDQESGLIYALKTESTQAERKTLKFEWQVLRRIQDNPYVPRLFDFGEKQSCCWILMELIGPSLSVILKQGESHKFGLSTGLRTSLHVLRAIKGLHQLGFIHRDIKPGNILVRISPNASTPIVLIDFGLVRVYWDQKTHKHLPERERTGFRGTKTYASLNAHMQHDLSRRDDIASWLYFTIDIIKGGLPWKGVANNADVAIMKNNFNIVEAVQDFAPDLANVYNHIKSLQFADEPDYEFIEKILINSMNEHNIKMDDPYDWDPIIQRYYETLRSEFGVQLHHDTGLSDNLQYRSELGLPKQVFYYAGKNVLNQSLLHNPDRRSYSQMQTSELNEREDGCCC